MEKEQIKELKEKAQKQIDELFMLTEIIGKTIIELDRLEKIQNEKEKKEEKASTGE